MPMRIHAPTRIEPCGGMDTVSCPRFQPIPQADTRYWKNLVYYPIPVSDLIVRVRIENYTDLSEYMDMHGMPRREGQFVYRFYDGSPSVSRAFIVSYDWRYENLK